MGGWPGLNQHESGCPGLASDAWVTLSFSLNGRMVGKTISQFDLGNFFTSPNGEFDVMIADLSIVHADGTVMQFPVTPGSFPWGGDTAAVTGASFTGETVGSNSGQVGAVADTNYYVDDHLGTAQMELASGGWPVWQGHFMPFGGELPDDSTAMHYKFTGKERDAESGLDYFGARYYASSMGRWASVDWATKPTPIPFATLANPQSLNLYSYVGNDPLSERDSDGHHQECDPDTSKVDLNGNFTVFAGKCHEVPDGPWWLAFNPWGKLGGPRHRQSVQQLAKLLRQDGYDDVQTEVKVETPNGAKSYRYVDVVGVKTRTGETKMYQVGDQNKDGSPIAREKSALDDIEKATGIRPQFEDKGVGERLEEIEEGMGSSQMMPEEEGAGEIEGDPEIKIDIP